MIACALYIHTYNMRQFQEFFHYTEKEKRVLSIFILIGNLEAKQFKIQIMIN